MTHHRPDEPPEDVEWPPPGVLGTMGELALSGLSILRELMQAPVQQVQDWLASDEGPFQGVAEQLREPWERFQQDLGRQLEALDRARAVVEERLSRGLEDLRRERRSTVHRIERVAISSPPAPKAPGAATGRSGSGGTARSADSSSPREG
jgi:hypothetical protein